MPDNFSPIPIRLEDDQNETDFLLNEQNGREMERNHNSKLTVCPEMNSSSLLRKPGTNKSGFKNYK